MKKLFILMNHDLLESQIKEAKEILKVDEIVNLSDKSWASIDPCEEKITDYLITYKNRLYVEAKKDDYLLVQGDFGTTYNMVNFAFANGIVPIYATTKRIFNEKTVEGKIVITREFVHARFRKYENEQ
ncbi:MAG: hypothetical protein LBG21_02140 [Campylobacteraceae bacterium]|jgi:hypothetical protein|nr:hypothetical protein [Campylobacteraceae bacterium]